MSTTPPTLSPPQRLLLATDLSPRCDRALDRAVQLAKQWRAPLTALHVIEPPRAPDQILGWMAGHSAGDLLQAVRDELQQDLAAMDTPADIRLARDADAHKAIVHTATEVGADLVITGVARHEPLGRWLAGSTVESLARQLAQPLLMVRNRARGPYQRTLVASDLSASSAPALRTASHWFAQAELSLFHARPAPGGVASGGVGQGLMPAAPDTYTKCSDFIDACRVPRSAVHSVLAFDGALAPTLTQCVRNRQVDLVVIGAHRDRGLLDALLTDALGPLLAWLPCDVLVVPNA